MSEDDDDREIDATPQRRERAAEAGHAARSKALTGAALAAAAVGLTVVWGPEWVDAGRELLVESFSGTAWIRKGDVDPAGELQQAGWWVLRQTAPAAAVMMLAAVGLEWMQTGFRFLPDRLSLDFSRCFRFDVGRIASTESGVQTVFSLLQAAAVVFAAGYAWHRGADAGAALWRSGDAASVAAWVGGVLFQAGVGSAAALAAMGAVDYLWQRRRFEDSLKMSDQEMREEARQSQGNPQVLAARRRLRRDRGAPLEHTSAPSSVRSVDASARV